jgi:hypothetical protein
MIMAVSQTMEQSVNILYKEINGIVELSLISFKIRLLILTKLQQELLLEQHLTLGKYKQEFISLKHAMLLMQI